RSRSCRATLATSSALHNPRTRPPSSARTPPPTRTRLKPMADIRIVYRTELQGTGAEQAARGLQDVKRGIEEVNKTTQQYKAGKSAEESAGVIQQSAR